ncbi:hypothetical protein N2152v2_008663 [Parachlorella kessleri]
MFWCFQLGALTLFIRFWVFGKRNDVEGVIRFLKWAFQYRVVQIGDEKLFKDRRCVYLANHRSWADFFVDMYVVAGDAVPLSRKEVGMAFPAFTSSLMAVKAILLFNRGGVKNLERFNSWLDKASMAAHSQNLLVYPEGTRSLRQASLPLKRGMLRYAYTRRLPVQVMITAHKEEVLNERRRTAHWGRTLVVGFSEVLDSTQFAEFDAFMAEVQRVWDAQWERVHSAPRQGKEYNPSYSTKQYSPQVLALQTAALAFWTAVLALAAYQSLRLLAAVAAWGLVGRVVLGGLALWSAASMAVALLPPPPRKAARKQE